ncbi:hypothetical protein NTGBS_860004 [Candidatus Nitrotoga sp. BS]|nr:hypothetical protein NTGBS_860004 [Candidatus Nitrotoga sp. BS]
MYSGVVLQNQTKIPNPQIFFIAKRDAAEQIQTQVDNGRIQYVANGHAPHWIYQSRK